MSNLTDTNQASELYELCKKVYELTEWRGEDGFITTIGGKWIRDYKKGWYDETIEADNFYPLYTSDYLLEKLPKELERKDGQYGASRGTVDLTRLRLVDVDWEASYRFEDEMNPADFKYASVSDTPLKALLKLTIALSEAGELK